MRIFGVDPGTSLTGYTMTDYHPMRPALVDCVIRPKPGTPRPTVSPSPTQNGAPNTHGTSHRLW
jgi:hypothetical protein